MKHIISSRKCVIVWVGLLTSIGCSGGGGSSNASSPTITGASLTSGTLVLTGTKLSQIQSAAVSLSGTSTPLSIIASSDSSLQIKASASLALVAGTVYNLLLSTANATTTYDIVVNPTGRSTCPAGLSLIGTAGSTSAFCIDTTERAVATYTSAIGSCATAGYYLCSHTEWYTACTTGTGFLATATNQEWSANPLYLGSLWTSMVSGNGSCGIGGTDTQSNTNHYRCCLK